MVVVFEPVSRSILLVHHKKAGSWIFPGGHVDIGELPQTTAVRELGEELGLTAAPQDLLGPVSLQVLDIESPFQRCREHYDLFYALSSASMSVKPTSDEFLGTAWLGLTDARERITSNYYREAFERFLSFMGW